MSIKPSIVGERITISGDLAEELGIACTGIVAEMLWEGERWAGMIVALDDPSKPPLRVEFPANLYPASFDPGGLQSDVGEFQAEYAITEYKTIDVQSLRLPSPEEAKKSWEKVRELMEPKEVSFEVSYDPPGFFDRLLWALGRKQQRELARERRRLYRAKPRERGKLNAFISRLRQRRGL